MFLCFGLARLRAVFCVFVFWGPCRVNSTDNVPGAGRGKGAERRVPNSLSFVSAFWGKSVAVKAHRTHV